MSDAVGQIRTEVPAGEEGGRPVTVISASREVEQGARSALVLAAGLFRLDVIPHDDTIQTILRNLSSAPGAALRLGDVGGSAHTHGGPERLEAPSTGRFGGRVVLLEEDGTERPVARILVGSVCQLGRGLTSFTAQATLL